MKTPDLINDAIRNTARNKLRTILTVMAIFVGAFTLMLTNSIGAGISSYINNQLGSVGDPDVLSISKPAEIKEDKEGPEEYEEKAPGQSNVGDGFNVTPLTKADLAKFETMQHVESVEPIIVVQPNYIQGNSDTKYVIGANPASSIMQPDLKTGTDFTEGTDTYEIILPQAYSESLGYNDSDVIGKTVTLGISDYNFEKHSVEATVVGVQNKSLFGDSAQLNIPLTETLDKLQKTGMPQTEEQYITAFVGMTPDLNEDSINALKSELEEAGYVATTMEDQIGSVQAVINGLIGVLNAFAVITLIAASFGIMNTLLMSVKERTREIGLMKAMGMSSKKIYALFSLEAVFIGFLGSAIGAIAAIGVGTLASSVLSQTLLADLEGLTISLFTFSDVATVILIVMFIAFLSGTIPAARAAKQNPIDALHYE